MAGDTACPGIVPAMPGIYSDPEPPDIERRRLPPDPHHQLPARAVVSQTVSPMLCMPELNIDPQDIILNLLIPGVPDFLRRSQLDDPVRIAGDPKNVHRDPRRVQQLKTSIRIPV